MVPVVQLVRASDCGSECRRFEPDRAPQKDIAERQCLFLFLIPVNQGNFSLVSWSLRGKNMSAEISAHILESAWEKF